MNVTTVECFIFFFLPFISLVVIYTHDKFADGQLFLKRDGQRFLRLHRGLGCIRPELDADFTKLASEKERWALKTSVVIFQRISCTLINE